MARFGRFGGNRRGAWTAGTSTPAPVGSPPGVPAGWTSQMLMAKTFVDNSGICMHFGSGGVWDGHSQIKTLFTDHPMKYIRGSWAAGNTTKRAFAQELRRDLGMRFNYWTDGTNFIPTQASLTARKDEIKNTNAGQAGTIFAIEGPNEPDAQGVTSSASKQFAIDVWNTMQGDPATAGIEVWSYSTANPSDGAKQTYAAGCFDMKPYCHRMNSHSYPGTQMLSNNTLMDQTVTWADKANGTGLSVPGRLAMTEAGQSTATGAQPGQAEAQRAQTIHTLWTNNYRRGVWPNAIFSMFPEGTTDAWHMGLGLVSNSYVATTSFVNLGNLAALLADPGADFTPVDVPYTLSGGNSTTRSMPLYKRDGSLWLVLWQEDPLTSTSGTVLTPTKPSVTVTTPTARAFTRYRIDSRTALATVASATSHTFTNETQATLLRVA